VVPANQRDPGRDRPVTAQRGGRLPSP
jgi:hypothetical protein